ncbi:MAG: response regulator transcription factor [Dehalococcoidia bacterium]|nr:response regulator transcription factor [Dehalococcoidia bacterium]
MTTILLAEGHKIVRQGLWALLEAEADFKVVGAAEDGLVAVELAASLKPDILIADLMLPGLRGPEVTRRVLQVSPDTRVIILSIHNSAAYVIEALRAGASGYVAENSTVAELMQGIREVTVGKRYLGSPFSDLAIEAYVQKSRGIPLDAYDTLTRREREVLLLAAEGHSNLDIALRLSISTRTAESHRANLMAKMGLHSRIELVRYALRQGILPLEKL